MTLVEKILQEAKQVGTLYHFTNYKNAIDIINSDIIKPHKRHRNNISGISFTRDKNFNKIYRNIRVPLTVGLVFDGDKISKNFKVTPYNDFLGTVARDIKDEWKNESEEFVQIKNKSFKVSDYLIGITFTKKRDDSFEEFSQTLYDLVKKNNIKILNSKNPLEEAKVGFVNTGGHKFWGNRGAGILPICLITGRILVNLRSEDVEEPGTYGVWGGAIEDDEEEVPTESARREFEEETGCTIPIRLIPAYVFKKGSFSYYNFIGIIKEEFTPNLDWESAGYKWVTLDELLKLKGKHFGLVALLKNSMDIIEKYAKIV